MSKQMEHSNYEETPKTLHGWCQSEEDMHLQNYLRYLKNGELEPDYIQYTESTHRIWFNEKPKRLTVDDFKNKKLFKVHTDEELPSGFKNIHVCANEFGITIYAIKEIYFKLCEHYQETPILATTYPNAPKSVDGFYVISPLMQEKIKTIVSFESTQNMLKQKTPVDIELYLQKVYPYNLARDILDRKEPLTKSQLLLINPEFLEYEISTLSKQYQSYIHEYYKKGLSAVQIAQNENVTRAYVHYIIKESIDYLRSLSHINHLKTIYNRAHDELSNLYQLTNAQRQITYKDIENEKEITADKNPIPLIKNINANEQPSLPFKERLFINDSYIQSECRSLKNEFINHQIACADDLKRITYDMWTNDLKIPESAKKRFRSYLRNNGQLLINLLNHEQKIEQETLLDVPIDWLTEEELLDAHFINNLLNATDLKPKTLYGLLLSLNINSLFDFLKVPKLGINAIIKTEAKLNKVQLSLININNYQLSSQPSNKYEARTLNSIKQNLQSHNLTNGTFYK